MRRFYASANSRKVLMRRNNSTFACVVAGNTPQDARPASPSIGTVAMRGQLQLFQMDGGIDKIARRDENRGKQTFVRSHLPLENLGYPYMKLNVALAASIAALALMTACAKKDAEVAAPAADAAAASADAAASSADAAASSAAAADAAAAAPADAAAAPADAAAAPADAAAPAEAPKQ
jgi:hypothetical protein